MRKLVKSGLMFAFFLSAAWMNAQSQSKTKQLTIPCDVITDKIRGGMLGQIIGNINGIPYEFKFYEQPGNVKDYVPGLPDGGVTDDDTDFEWVYIYKMQQQRNVYLPYEDVNNMWINSINKRIWCANRYSRYLMDLEIVPPLTGSTVLNPWADFNLGGQFLCETFGLIAPGMPQTANRIGLHYTKVTIDDEPAQVTQLFTSMIATAFMENDINKIINAGLAGIDKKSIVNKIVADVKKWHDENPQDWEACRAKIHQNYQNLNDDLTRNRNGIEMNTAAIIGALLYGKGDFKESIQLAFNFGYDADCNAATVGTIIGTTYGYKKMLAQGWQIVDRYKNTTRDGMPMDETITSFADRLVDLFEIVNNSQGGKKTIVDNVPVYEISAESPRSVYALKSYDDNKAAMNTELKTQIYNDILKGDRQAKARGAYLAVCSDMANDIKKTYPAKWKEACYELSGYWKVMNNVFYGGVHQSLKNLKAKFSEQGFVKPLKATNEKDMYVDLVPWKEPSSIY